MPATAIDPFELPFTVKVGDEVEFCTETEERKRFLGRITNVNTYVQKMFYDIEPITGMENQFPNIYPKLVRITRGFIVRKLNPDN